MEGSADSDLASHGTPPSTALCFWTFRLSRRKKCDLRRSSATFTTASWSACKTGQIDVGEAEEACSKLPRLQLFPRRGRLARCSYATQIAFNTHHIHPSGSQRVVPDANAITSLQKLVVFQPLSRTWFVSPGETGAISAVRSPPHYGQ